MALCMQDIPGQWHVTCPAGDSSFRPVVCSTEEGIVLPGRLEEREPTCPDCLVLIR